MTIDDFLQKVNSPTSLSLAKIVKIKKYLPIKKKFEFADEFKKEVEKQKDNYPNCEAFIAFMIFNLLIVKYYTDIELDITCDNYDKLQECKWIDEINKNIGSDLELILTLLQMKG